MANQDANQYLPVELRAQIEVVGWKGSHRQHFGTHGTIDLKELTIELAEKLIRLGFIKLKYRIDEAIANAPERAAERADRKDARKEARADRKEERKEVRQERRTARKAAKEE